MEKKLTNSDPLREPADKHSIYPRQRVEGFIFHPFEVGEILTQCVHIVVSKPN